MIPSSYRTEAEALAIRNTYGEGSLLLTSMYTNGSTSTNPGLDGVLSADALARIQGTDLSGVTSTISTTVSGGFTSADAAYIDGMRTRLSASITEFYSSKPNLSPFNTNNKQSGQSDANVRDNFLQAIFKYDARYGERLRLDETEVITRLDTGEYVLPNRTSFIKNPWVEATMRLHGAGDINSIDDTGTGGAYRVTTATKHGLYDGQLLSATQGATAPSPMAETHVEKTITKLTQPGTSSTTAPASSYYTTSANHYFVNGQKFVPTNVEIGITGYDTEDKYWAFQRDRYIKVLSATTFELHRNYACTDRISTGYYNGSMNFSQTGTGDYYVTGVTMQTLDGMPILFDSTGSTDTSVSVFQKDTIVSVNTSNGAWSTSAAIKDGIQDGMLTNFNNFTGSTWSGIDSYNYPLYFKKLDNTSFSLHTSPTVLNDSLWIPGTTSNLDLDAVEYTSSTWTATFTRPHNLLNGQDFRMRSVTADFGGQEIDAYYYLGVNNAGNYWLLADTSDNILDGSRIYISTSASGGQGTTITIQSTQVTVPQNGLYVKRVGGAGNRKVQLFTDAAMTTQWTPLAAVGVEYAVGANTFLANIYFAKVVDSTTVELYSEPTLTTKWNPNDGSTAVTAITSGATGNTLATNIVITYTSPGGGYIQPMFFPDTSGYTGITLYKDQELTEKYILSNTGVVSGTGGFIAERSTTGCYRMNAISHYMAWIDTGNSSVLNELNFSNTKVYPAFYINVTSDTVFDLYVDSGLTVPYTTPAIGTTGATSTPGSMVVAQYQQDGAWRLDKIIGRNIGLLTYYYNNYDAGTTPVNAQVSTTFYPTHYESNVIYDYVGNNNNWPGLSVAEYSNSNAGVYYGHLRPIKAGSSDAGNTGRVGVDSSIYGVTQGSPMYYDLNRPGRFKFGSPMILGIKVQGDTGTFTENPLDYNGVPWTQGTVGQPYRDWPQTVQPTSMTWTIEQPTQVLETVNMNRYTRTRDVSQYRYKLTYPPMTSAEIQPFIAVIHAAGGAYKPFKFWFPRNNNIAMTVSMQSKSAQTSNHFFVRTALTAGTRVIQADGLPQNKTENDPAFFAGAGLNMRISNGQGSMMVPIHNVRTNEYGEANIRINNGIPANIAAGEWMDSYINYTDVFLDGNSVDIKVDTRGYHYLEVDMITKRVF
jgi:hypothetical protein